MTEKTDGMKMAEEWFNDNYAKGGFTEGVIRQLYAEVQKLTTVVKPATNGKE